MYSSSISETSNFKSAASLRYITMELSVSDLISVKVRPIFSPFSHLLTLEVSIPSFSKKSVTNVPSWSSETRAKSAFFTESRKSYRYICGRAAEVSLKGGAFVKRAVIIDGIQVNRNSAQKNKVIFFEESNSMYFINVSLIIPY